MARSSSSSPSSAPILKSLALSDLPPALFHPSPSPSTDSIFVFLKDINEGTSSESENVAVCSQVQEEKNQNAFTASPSLIFPAVDDVDEELFSIPLEENCVVADDGYTHPFRDGQCPWQSFVSVPPRASASPSSSSFEREMQVPVSSSSSSISPLSLPASSFSNEIDQGREQQASELHHTGGIQAKAEQQSPPSAPPSTPQEFVLPLAPTTATAQNEDDETTDAASTMTLLSSPPSASSPPATASEPSPLSAAAPANHSSTVTITGNQHEQYSSFFRHRTPLHQPTLDPKLLAACARPASSSMHFLPAPWHISRSCHALPPAATETAQTTTSTTRRWWRWRNSSEETFSSFVSSFFFWSWRWGFWRSRGES